MMLVLRRKEGQWIEVTHKSGDVLRVRVYNLNGPQPGSCSLAFKDVARNFDVHRPERVQAISPSLNWTQKEEP